ncbi:MAG: S9 family peptidase [Gammaproteobacteria bacterium]|nr:MAG: S9 family peptidase [Gammaproteobacteria bacterium]
MNAASSLPYGSWPSPFAANELAAGNIRLSLPCIENGNLYWLEQRPAEGGRTVLVCQTAQGERMDITPQGYDIRSRVHEYGGGAYVVHENEIVFVNAEDQCLYHQTVGRLPQAITKAGPHRYADLVFDAQRQLIWCIRESHEGEGEPGNCLIHVDLETGRSRIVADNADFVASPCLSPDGRRLAWLSWSHPDMPWDSSLLWVADINPDGNLTAPIHIAGGNNVSIFQPRWSPGGRLFYISDASGWWNPWCWDGAESSQVLSMKAEFALPQWVFGMSTYAVLADNHLLCSYSQQGSWYLAHVDVVNQGIKNINLPYSDISAIGVEGDVAVFLGASITENQSIVSMDLVSDKHRSITKSVAGEGEWISVPQAVSYADANGEEVYAFYYAPQGSVQAPASERPPLLVVSHGGPTAASSNAFNYKIQYWSSRGFAVLDVNYRGSTGFGRAYRECLNGQWGLIDVADCETGARWLGEQGLADTHRLAIRGSSAGGYTTLCALTFYDTFHAGASHYGIGDLEALARDTHKFESHYLDRLVGPYPDAIEIYRSRSPVHHVEQLRCPVAFFQGLEDRVVPAAQAEAMVAAIKDKGIAVAYMKFADEQHGFRKAENIKAALEGELYFYGRIFGFVPADTLQPLPIMNLA